MPYSKTLKVYEKHLEKKKVTEMMINSAVGKEYDAVSSALSIDSFGWITKKYVPYKSVFETKENVMILERNNLKKQVLNSHRKQFQETCHFFTTQKGKPFSSVHNPQI